METKKFIVFFCVFFLVSSILASSYTIQTKNERCEIPENEVITIPEWNIGNYWKYDMDFVFQVEGFDANAVINNMYATLTEFEYTKNYQVYVLSISGDISGELSLNKPEIDVADFYGDFSGEAYINKNTLGIKKFEFFVDGFVNIPIIGRKDMDFEMSMDFSPSFDIFNFPIYPSEQPWQVHIDKATLYAHIDIDVPFGEHEYDSSVGFDDTISIKGAETINGYDSIVLGGDWGHRSNLYYAKDAGYLVKVDEGINLDDIISEFHLDLIETNYNTENLPPNPPNKPVGETEGEEKKEYSYETSTIDPNQDDVFYKFDWGDGTYSDWLGPYSSGNKISATHKWFSKGAYTVMVKAKDINGIESSWSEPLSVMIKGDPKVNVIVHRIEKKDEIDWGQSMEPEWYYEVSLEGSTSPPKRFHNTDDGKYNGEWNHKNNWQPDKSHVFKVNNKQVVVKIKLMDYDDFWEGDNDDLADISGCNYPHTNGKDDIEDDSNLPRGAIYHGTYNVLTGELKPYHEDHTENADFVYEEYGYYITCGDYEPDSSIRYENGIKDPENDAKVYFKIEDDYKYPQVTAEVKTIDGKVRPLTETQFVGKTTGGAPGYSWNWDFGDGETSTEQNPKHIYQDTGTYTVKLSVTDNFGEKDSATILVNVVNKNPILSKDKVDWTGKGGKDDTFTFSVYYFDPDLDEPGVKNLVLDGTEKTLVGSGSSSYYNLELKGREIGKGTHKFYFHFEDGYGGVAETSEKTFKVKMSGGISKTSILHRFFQIFQRYSLIVELLNNLS